jgi:hypothetical protein
MHDTSTPPTPHYTTLHCPFSLLTSCSGRAGTLPSSTSRRAGCLPAREESACCRAHWAASCATAAPTNEGLLSFCAERHGKHERRDKHSEPQHITSQHITAHHSTEHSTEHSTSQHSTAHHSTEHSTSQHSSVIMSRWILQLSRAQNA